MFIQIITILLFTLPNQNQNQKLSLEPNYLEYHKIINSAERYFFIDKNHEKALESYNEAFEKFNFIFLRDLLNAAQIAVFKNQPFKKYLLRAFKFGLKLDHLDKFPLLKGEIEVLKSDSCFVKNMHSNYEQYRKSIDLNYLLAVYDMGIQDQIDKGKETHIYTDITRLTTLKVKHLILSKGFPNSSIIGIDNTNAFSEFGIPKYDLDSRKRQFADDLDYYKTTDNALAMTRVMVILVHNRCAFIDLKDLLYSCMLKGEIHPREIGLLYDNMFRSYSVKIPCSKPKIEKGLFFLNLFCDYSPFKVSPAQINKLRKEWAIVEIEVDYSKKEHEKVNGFKLSYGFWNCM